MKTRLASGLSCFTLIVLWAVACATPTQTPTPAPLPPSTATPTLTPTAHPRAINLEKVADLPGGDIVSIRFGGNNPNVVYLASNTNAMGIWRSDDAGETWRQLAADTGSGGPAHINDIAVHPDDPDVLLEADAHSLIKLVTVQGVGQWRIVYPTSLIGGGIKAEQPVHVSSVAFSPSSPTIAYAVLEKGNILKSTDSGDTWQETSRLEPSWGGALAVDPRTPDTLYAGTGTGLVRSIDGGRTWKQLSSDGVSAISIVDAVPDLIFIAGGAGVFRSSDGGATWRRTLQRQAHSVAVAPSDSRTVYAGTPEGVFKSSDGGETWRAHNTGIELPNVGSVAIHPKNANIVVAGSDIGLWTNYAIWDGKGKVLSFPTTGEGIYKTTDGGLLWTKKGREFIDRDVIEVAVDPSNPNIVYAGTRCSRGIYRSDDGGVSWNILDTGPGKMAHYTMRIVIAQDSTVWLTGVDGMGGSTDGGHTWQPALAEQGRHFHGIAVSPQDPRVVLVGTVGHGPPGTPYYPGARIIRTVDAGKTWQTAGAGFPHGTDTAIDDIAFDPLNPSTIYVTTAEHHRLTPVSTTLGIYKTSDGGQTWTPANTGLDIKTVHSIALSPTRTGLLYAGTHIGVYRSYDGGGAWQPTTLRQHVWRLIIDPVDPRSLYAGTQGGLFWSPDGGDTWQRQDSVPPRPVEGLAIDAHGKVLYAAVNGVGVFKAVIKR